MNCGPMTEPSGELTEDAFLGGRLRLRQPKSGHRAGHDAMLLAAATSARVGDRVIFSMPTAATPNPPLHLVNLPLARVDWDRTTRYAATARASHYIERSEERRVGKEC